MAELTPDYINIDYTTLVEKLKNAILDSDVFKDLDYEGSNISILTELFGYIGDLNVYYNNKIAQESYIDTSEIYENVYRHSINKGYIPRGYISSYGTLNLSISGLEANKSYVIKEWGEFYTEDLVDENGDQIYFVNIDSLTFVPSGSTYSAEINVKQGKIIKYTDDETDPYRKDEAFRGTDLVNNKLYLPFLNFGYDNNLQDTQESIKVFINGDEWTRISDFYDKLSGLENETKVYSFRYDKNNQYIIEFSESREVPLDTDEIEIWLLESLGSQGNITSNAIKNLSEEQNILWNETDSVWMLNEQIYSIDNSSSIIGGTDPETIEEIKQLAKNAVYSQQRCVSKADYIYYLKENSEVFSANAWGEKEQNPDGGNVYDYNKVYLSLIPSYNFSEWDNKLNYITYTTDKNEIIYIPTDVGYNVEYKQRISEWLEPRKMIGTWEEYIPPEVVYFAFNFSLDILKTYKFDEVLKDFKNKLTFYFQDKLNNFGNILDYKDLIYEMENPKYSSQNDSFSKTQGIKKVIIREIKYFNVLDLEWKPIEEYSSSAYPRWEVEKNETEWDYNTLRNIIINSNQFATVSLIHSNFAKE